MWWYALLIPASWKAEADETLSLKSTWSPEPVPGQPEVQREETLSHKKTKKFYFDNTENTEIATQGYVIVTPTLVDPVSKYFLTIFVIWHQS